MKEFERTNFNNSLLYLAQHNAISERIWQEFKLLKTVVQEVYSWVFRTYDKDEFDSLLKDHKENYERLQFIAQGGGGSAILMQRKTDLRYVVVKEQEIDKFEEECATIRAQKVLNHPNILPIDDVYLDEKEKEDGELGKFICTVQDYEPFGDLLDYVNFRKQKR